MGLSKLLCIKILFLAVPLFLFLWFIHFRGFISYDDGWFLQDALRLLNGEKIYKDFHYLYNPGSLYINAVAFKLFGVSIFASRIMAFLNSAVAIILLYLIVRKLSYSRYISFFLISSFLFWGPAHINFVWPVMFCITLALTNGTLFLYADKKNEKYFLLVIGVVSAIIFILKQNFGLAIMATNVLYLLYRKDYRNVRSFVWYFCGYIGIMFLQLWYFLATDTLSYYLKDFYDYTIIKIGKQGVLNSGLPWDYPGPVSIKVIKFFLYFSPVLISLWSLIKMHRNKKSMLVYFPLVGLSFYTLSIRPTTDYIHLAPLIALSLVPLYFLYEETVNKNQKMLFKIILVSFLFAGMYSSIYRNYYRWNTPLIKQTTYLNHPTLRIYTDDKEKQSVTQLVEYFDKNAKDEKYTFIYYFTPIYYMILNKQNPTKYDDLQLGGVSEKDQKEIITILIEKKVNHIITDVDISEDKSFIAQFIKLSYKTVKKVNEYTIWKMK